jgi:hypothetical protein
VHNTHPRPCYATLKLINCMLSCNVCNGTDLISNYLLFSTGCVCVIHTKYPRPIFVIFECTTCMLGWSAAVVQVSTFIFWSLVFCVSMYNTDAQPCPVYTVLILIHCILNCKVCFNQGPSVYHLLVYILYWFVSPYTTLLVNAVITLHLTIV